MKKLIEAEEGLYIEKKSKFICHLFKVSDPDEAQELLKDEKKRYFDAKHHCYAYILGENGENVKCSDDGEPSGTAGRPMLDILKREGVTDVLCVVTRYFGGVLLGTGGLVRAYSEALKDAIDKSSFAFEEDAVKTSLSYNYSFDAKITSYLNNNNITVLSKDYSENILLKIVVKMDDFESINEGLINLTNGTVNCEDKEICKYAF